MTTYKRTAEMEQLVYELIDFLQKNELFLDVCIYVGGRRWLSDYSAPNGYRIEENCDPHDYLEYAPVKDHLLSMSFEGPLYEVLNYYRDGYTKTVEKFDALFKKYGLWYEFGYSWCFSCYDD